MTRAANITPEGHRAADAMASAVLSRIEAKTAEIVGKRVQFPDRTQAEETAQRDELHRFCVRFCIDAIDVFQRVHLLSQQLHSPDTHTPQEAAHWMFEETKHQLEAAAQEWMVAVRIENTERQGGGVVPEAEAKEHRENMATLLVAVGLEASRIWWEERRRMFAKAAAELAK